MGPSIRSRTFCRSGKCFWYKIACKQADSACTPVLSWGFTCQTDRWRRTLSLFPLYQLNPAPRLLFRSWFSVSVRLAVKWSSMCSGWGTGTYIYCPLQSKLFYTTAFTNISFFSLSSFTRTSNAAIALALKTCRTENNLKDLY